MDIKKKRDRTSNFSTYEKRIFLSILATPEIKSVIENKKTDRASIRRKDEIWQEVTSMFNCNARVERRDVNHLKRLYDNLKRLSRRKYAANRKSQFVTADGEFTKNSYVIDERILSIQPKIEPLQNLYEDREFNEFENHQSCEQIQSFDKEATESQSSSALEDNKEFIYFESDDDPKNLPSTSATPTISEEELVDFKYNTFISTPGDCEKTSVSEARNNLAALANSRSLLMEMEKSLLLERHREEMKLIALKIENEKKKSLALEAKLLYYKNKK